MVGHSVGGIIASLYAMSYPQDVKGMVLVDSSHEDQQRRMQPIAGPPPPKKLLANPPPGVPPPPPPGLRFEDFAAELRKVPFRGAISPRALHCRHTSCFRIPGTSSREMIRKPSSMPCARCLTGDKCR
jgi:pimeloyl-ACP methyl ester carboxylesterase